MKKRIEKVYARLQGSLCLVFGFYGNKVLRIHRMTTDPEVVISYPLHKPMPLLDGVTSRVLLAHLQPYQQRNRGANICAATIGQDSSEFRPNLKQTR